MRLIDVDSLGICKAKRELFKIPEYADGWNEALEIIFNTETLSYKDLVPQGEWIDCRGGNATCSRCRIRQKAVYDDDNEQHFCGHCGARMVSK